MKNLFIFLFGGGITSVIMFMIIYFGVIIRMKENYKSDIWILKDYKEKYYDLISEHMKAVNELNFYRRNQIIDDDVKSAVRFAMINSHPDKGICKDNDTFIKFRGLYDKYK